MRPWPTTTTIGTRSRPTPGRETSSSRSSGRASRPSSRRRGSRMPRTIRFHLDENCSRAIADGLRLQGIDVTTTPDAGLLNALDEEHVAYARREDRVVFTQDRDFLRLHAAGEPHLGIAYCQKDSLSIGEI